ncbi:MAG: hypothetical protein ABI772_06555 [Bacteroidota bacterium]
MPSKKMEEAAHIILIVHIICGSIALLSGPVAMLNQTGNNLHRLSGKLFFYAMSVVFVTAIYLSIVHHLLFLFLIAIFSYYNIVIAYRALYLKKLGNGQKPKLIDWIITIITSVLHGSLIVWGIYVSFIMGQSFGSVAVIFGSIGGLMNIRAFKHYINGYREKNDWLIVHISGMIAGYIAATTAFLVNVITFQPSFILWLAPSVIFVPYIIYTTRKFKKKFNKGKQVSELARIEIMQN